MTVHAASIERLFMNAPPVCEQGTLKARER
jgi:hypothetical protein